MATTVTLDGRSLTIADVVSVARHRARVAVDEAAARRAQATRAIIERAAAGDGAVYGLNTGFGKLASVRVPHDQLLQLQRNLILSHVAGVGAPLPADVVRAVMLLRANVLLKETSGVRPVLAQRLAGFLNAGIHPIVPEQGSVGASGDLAPLAHVALALIGEGEVAVGEGETGDGSRLPAATALKRANLEPLSLEAKEGIAFINGTQAQTAMLSLAVADARSLWRSAHGAAAMSLEALRGTPTAFDERLHAARPTRARWRRPSCCGSCSRTARSGSRIAPGTPGCKTPTACAARPRCWGPCWTRWSSLPGSPTLS